MPDFIPGTKTTLDGGQADVILDLKDGLKYLNPAQDGIALLKKLGTNAFSYANQKIEWAETALARRKEVITITNVATVLTVANSRQYHVGTLFKCENEVLRVVSGSKAVPHPSATTMTVTRGYGGTTAVAHTAKTGFSLGTAMVQGADAVNGLTDDGDRLFNYSQTFERAVSMSKDEIAELNVEGANPLNKQLERRYIEINRELFQACLYGNRSVDPTNQIHAMGGLTQFVTTNVANAGGAAISIAAIDDIILAQVQAGADPKFVCVSPYQKRKLDAIDANKQLLDKREHTGGNLNTQTWQSGVVGHDLEVFVDHTILDDQIWIGDFGSFEIGNKSHAGVVGNFHVENSTLPGADREDRVIRGKYSTRVNLEKGLGYIYGLA